MKTDEIEKAFEEHLDEELGSSTRRRFYNKNPYVLAAARTAFTAGARSRDEEIEQLREDLKWALDTINHIWEIERAPLDFDGERALEIRAKHGLDKEEA